jgi:anti-anti-sigma regulatory factor
MTQFRIDGSAGIVSAAELRDRLMAAIGDSGDMEIDCSALDAADLTCIQLIVATQRCLEARGSILRFEPPPSPHFTALFERAGVPLPDVRASVDRI